MSTPANTIYFPLGANAHGVIAGAPFDTFRERVKVAALLHDRVVLEDGSWWGVGGEGVNYRMRMPAGTDMQMGLQGGSTRHRLQASKVSLLVSADEASEPTIPVFDDRQISVFWHVSFEALRTELPHAYEWIDFDHLVLAPDVEAQAKLQAAGLEDHPLLVARYAEPFTRHLVATNAYLSMALASAMTASVSMDRLHSGVLASRIAMGEAFPLGERALLAIVPKVRDLSWEQVHAARSLPGLPRLREALTEFEMAASEGAARGFALDAAIHREYEKQYAKAQMEAEEGWGSFWRSQLLGTCISLAVSPFDPAAALVADRVVALIAETGRRFLGEHRTRNTWRTAADELRAMAERTDP